MPNSHSLMQRIRRLFCEWHCSGVLAAASFAACASSATTFAYVQEEGEVTVADIRIEGNQTIPESVILQKIQSQPERSISERLIREDKRSLMSTRWFFSVTERIDETPDGLILVFTVHERPIVQRVEFVGNKKIKLKHLTAWTGLKAGSPYDYVANREAVSRIEQEYKEKGYYFVEVTLVKGGQPGERDVVFRIEEGPKVQVNKRTFEGNRFWNDGDLRKNLLSKEKILIFGGLYNPDTIPADIEAIKQYYRGVGFFDVEVTAEPLFSDDKSDVNLHYTVTEGRRYKVREVRYEGNSIVSTSRLRNESKLNAGDEFNSYPLSKDVKRMLGYYGEMGHYFASVNPVPHFTEQEGIVDLVIEIDEDRPRYVRSVNVSYGGDYPHTKQTVVLDRIQVQPGDLADPKFLNRGRSRLSGSGLFEPGIGFDVKPVEPEQGSFAQNSASRTWRGQNPAHSPSDWTQRFTQQTHISADEAVMGGFEWDQLFLNEEHADEADDEDSDEIEVSDPAATSTPLKSAEEARRSFQQQQSSQSSVAPRTAVSRDRLQYVSSRLSPAESNRELAVARSGVPIGSDIPVVHALTASELPAFGHSFGRSQTNTVQTGSLRKDMAIAGTDFDYQTARPVMSSDLVEFKTVEPVSLFSVPTPTFLTSRCDEDIEEPIIRAQSPQRAPVDPATPGYNDAILEGSPYRNQFRDIPPGWVDIDVNATEGRTGRLMFGAGVNSNAGLVGSFVWDESNFDLFRPPTSFADIIEGRAWRGGGQRFRAEAAPGSQVSRYSVSWTDPYFMYTDFSLSVSGFYFNRFYPDWTEDRYGGRVAFGKQFTPEWSGNVALRLEEVNMKNPRLAPPLLPKIAERSLGTSLLSTVRVSATHDTRDSSMMPTEGHYFDAGYEQAFNDFSFPKAETEFRQYFTVFNRPDGSGRHVVTVAGVAGWSGDDTPVFERYYAGGFQSFRGFAYRGVTPRENNFATGGTFQALGTVEYRVPVTADDMINVVAFSDFGTVDDTVTMNNFRASAGFGLRVVIPAMGPVPLAFDFAFPITKQTIDDDQIFSFYVGINR